MTCSLDFEKASQYVRVRATAEQELTMLEHRFASHEVVARLTGLPVAAVRTIRNNLGIDATTTRRLARAEQAHAAFCMYLQGRTATGIGEAQGVSAAVVSQQIARFLRRVLKVRNESRAAHDWNTLRAEPEIWLAAADLVLAQMQERRAVISDALEERRARLGKNVAP